MKPKKFQKIFQKILLGGRAAAAGRRRPGGGGRAAAAGRRRPGGGGRAAAAGRRRPGGGAGKKGKTLN